MLQNLWNCHPEASTLLSLPRFDSAHGPERKSRGERSRREESRACGTTKVRFLDSGVPMKFIGTAIGDLRICFIASRIAGPAVFAELILSKMRRFFASLRMTSEGIRMTGRRAENNNPKEFLNSVLDRSAPSEWREYLHRFARDFQDLLFFS
jgi:hypothetical protein